jgi:hypothetical protein
MLRPWGILVATVALTACGPDVAETRLGFYPPREPECTLEFVQADPGLFGPTGPWELVGYVNISEKHTSDPFSPKYRKIVRARACSMGGEAVTVTQAASKDARFGSATGVTFGVLRHRRAPGPGPTNPF